MMLEKATEFKFNYLEYPGMIEFKLDPTPKMALALAQVNIVTLNAAMEAVTRLDCFRWYWTRWAAIQVLRTVGLKSQEDYDYKVLF